MLSFKGVVLSFIYKSLFLMNDSYIYALFFNVFNEVDERREKTLLLYFF